MNPNTKVLIVDDYHNMTQAVTTLLQISGLENVDEAHSGPEALEKLKNEHFDVVISDWNMSPMPGRELLFSIRNDETLKTLPVIIISAEKRTEIVKATKEAGASAYLIKPFKADTLVEKIQTVLKEAS